MKKSDIKHIVRIFMDKFIDPKEQWVIGKEIVIVNWLYYIHEKYDAGLINLEEYITLAKVCDKVGNYIDG